MDRECCICGKICDERDMFKRSPSPAKPKWLCWECYKLGHGEGTGVETQSIKRRIREKHKE